MALLSNTQQEVIKKCTKRTDGQTWCKKISQNILAFLIGFIAIPSITVNRSRRMKHLRFKDIFRLQEIILLSEREGERERERE